MKIKKSKNRFLIYCFFQSDPKQRPLTRYLPIKDDFNFNLKGHIESAGHQIDINNGGHVNFSKTSARGYLQKLSCGKFRNSWHKRWFVFDRNRRSFSYFGDKNGELTKYDSGTHISFDVSIIGSFGNKLFCSGKMYILAFQTSF